MSRIHNAIVNALNEQNHKLPRFIIIIPDHDIIRFINHFGFGISHIVGTCLSWMVRNIEHALEAKKDFLRKCKPGALRANEPKIIWVKCFTRPDMPPLVAAGCNKFNNILEELLTTRKCHYIIDINKYMESAAFFNHGTYLNNKGKESFWLGIDRMIEGFDYGKEDLLPVVKQQRPIPAHPQQYNRPRMAVQPTSRPGPRYR